MPFKPPRVCRCGKVVPAGTVCTCQRQRKIEYDRRRPSSKDRGYDSKWRIKRAAFLARPENRYCACGCGRLADMIDHIISHKGDQRLFWNEANWQPMASSPCHASRKQSLERKAMSKTNVHQR